MHLEEALHLLQEGDALATGEVQGGVAVEEPLGALDDGDGDGVALGVQHVDDVVRRSIRVMWPSGVQEGRSAAWAVYQTRTAVRVPSAW